MQDTLTHKKLPGTSNISDLNNQTQLDFMAHAAETLNQPIDYCKSYGELRNWSIYLTTDSYSIFIRYKNDTHLDTTSDENIIASWEKLGKYSIVTTDGLENSTQQELLAFWPGIRLAWFEIMTWQTYNKNQEIP